MPTIYQLHDSKINDIIIAEARLPSLKEELKKSNRKNLIKEIDEISCMRIKYQLSAGFLLNKYIEIDKKPRLGLDMLGKKGFTHNTSKKEAIYHSFRSIVDPDYVYVDEDIINEEKYCYDCKCFRVTLDEEAMICLKCRCQTIIKETHIVASKCDYQRSSHFNNWIERIQGKEKTSIPIDIIDTVKQQIKREHKKQLTEKDIRYYLKKCKISFNFYDHSVKILWIVTGIQPQQMTTEMEDELRNMFSSIQKPFELYKGDRCNFISYAYVLYKFCQIQGYNEFLLKFRLFKNENLIYKHDCIWKKICGYMGWDFIKTDGNKYYKLI